ncbi:Alkaline phosphatase-like alpha/beta/alpha [Penicillium paradoxum]|uniref:Alkaline phosphatase-like alpha/beta/alpha n=1 Tax=Penicillium paradoxum TaxID=176176 RepID=UPI002547BBFF|nr:Alkaline phosphatase-like alpha/beta/alpha [Penicillium paradoxum]KAJ5793698.1 Alkaline phosphatase-like alpha/beta/alpha [Penicillium paradoxum]
MMKSSWQGDLPRRLWGKLGEAAIFALAFARSPQLYIDHGWTKYRAYLFSVIFISLGLSKVFHILVHLTSLTIPALFGWGPTFFFADIILILLARSLARSYRWRTTRDIAAVTMVLLTLYASSMVSANISYYVNIGMEIHWRKSSGFHKKSPSFLLVISALAVAILVDAGVFVAAHFATPYLSRATAAFLQLWGSLLSAAFGCFRRKKHDLPDPETYEEIAIDDFDVGDDSDSVELLDTLHPPPQQKSRSLAKRVVVIVCTITLVFLRCIRPSDMVYSYIATSLPLAPFAGLFFRSAQGSVSSLPGDFSWLEGRTALHTFPTFEWLRANGSSEALPDWSPFQMNHLNQTALKDHLYEHYNPAKDPLHIPNLQNNILDSIRDVLHSGDLKIKHVILIKLESNRQDVFPFRSDSYIMKHVKDSHDGQIPEEILDRLSNLTRTAEMLSGFETGFKEDTDRPKPYGSISAKNAYTSGTYTMKSITGTMCGVNPIAVQNNLEYLHDIYQPCLPHIFEALNHQPNITNQTDDWTSWPWHPMWMQSHYGTYDHQTELNPAMGFKDITNKETINEGGAIYIPEEPEEEQKYGHPDHTLKNYIRDAFESAKNTNTRLFLAHLTHNTHTPWFKPGEYEDFLGNTFGWNEKINRYLNTIAYQDAWLADILEIINEAGVADETLLVMAGDHGLSLPNDGGITANHDPHVASFHVPLLLAHPKLPQVEISDAVLSTQMLPSILDLLIETSSVNEGSMKVLKDLLPLYQGQSLLRPLIPEQDKKQEWHVSTMNPGGTWISLRAAAKPYRLVVPLISDAPWRFTNVVNDPLEFEPDEDTDITSLFDAVQTRHGSEAARWLSEAAHVSQWWIAENHRRWKYSPEDSN